MAKEQITTLAVNDYNLNGYMPFCCYNTAMNNSALGYFLGQCTTQSFFDNLGKGFTQGLEFVTYARIYPYNVMEKEYTDNPVRIYIGNTTAQVYTDTIYKARLGSCKTKIHITKEFTDLFGSMTRFNQAYPYVQVDCYLPYVGFITLDINELRKSGNYLKVDLVIDVISGNGIYSFSRHDLEKNGWYVFYTTQTNFATSIAIGGSNATEQDKALFNAFSQIGIGIAEMGLGVGMAAMGMPKFGIGMGISGLGSVVGSLSSAVNADTEHVVQRGVNGNFPSSINNPHAIYFIVKTKKVNDYDSFKSYYGKPLNKKKALSELKGITFIPNPKIEIANITKEEFELLNQNMLDGIIL